MSDCGMHPLAGHWLTLHHVITAGSALLENAHKLQLQMLSTMIATET